MQMQCHQTYVPEEAQLQVDESMEKVYYHQMLQKNCLTFSDCPVFCPVSCLLENESVEKFQQETEHAMNNLYSKGHHSSERSLTNRRELKRERERERQGRLRRAFNVLRSVIPDYFSKREPGDRLSKVQTLRVANNYTATLQELIETC